MPVSLLQVQMARTPSPKDPSAQWSVHVGSAFGAYELSSGHRETIER